MRFVLTEVGSAAVNVEHIVTIFVAKGVMHGAEDIPKEAREPAWQVVVSISNEFSGPTYRLAHLPFTDEGHEEAHTVRTQLALLLSAENNFEDGTVLQWDADVGWCFLDPDVYLSDEVDDDE